MAAALLRGGIAVSTAEPFATTAHVPHAIRIALGAANLPTLRDALEKVRRTVDDHTHRR
ncbi:hypothetical protein [Nocardia crassostreae]|uniref:hypothetical protein n=1 Tax=Nocardia crassostreae TaxID=53428 RepID=UPI000B28D318|nr:hypothetical protein [Nocardia crassostreae]